MFAVLRVSVSLLVAMAWDEPEQVMVPDNANAANATQGNMLLHSRVIPAGKKTIEEEDVTSNSLGHGDVMADGTFVGRIAGAILVVHADTPAARWSEQEWVIIQDRMCNSSAIADFEAALAPNVIKRWHGHTSIGLCALLVKATKSALQKTIEKAKGDWSSKHTVVETNSYVKLLDAQDYDPYSTAISRVSWIFEFLGYKSREPWNLDRIDDHFGLDSSYTITGGWKTTVYVLDTGVSDTHVEFEGRAIRFADFTNIPYGTCKADNPKCALDWNGHGTLCAGTIAGNRFGVAKKTHIKAIKVFSDDGTSTSGQSFQGIDAVMIDKTMPSVVAMSLGNLGTSKAYQHAVAQLNHVGIPVVVAAGDQNVDACTAGVAYIPAAITVGSTNKYDLRSSFSNYGECVDIFAPGSIILSAWPSFDVRKAWPSFNRAKKVHSSTSMASSAVAGAAALLFAKNATLSAEAVRDTLLRLATRNKIKDEKNGSHNRLLYVVEDMGQTPLREMTSVCIGNTGPVWAMSWWVKLQLQGTDMHGKRVFVQRGCCMSLADIPSITDRDVLEIYAEGKLKAEGRLLETVLYRPQSGTGLYECSGPANSWKCMLGKTNKTVEPSSDSVCSQWEDIKDENSSFPTRRSKEAN